MKKIFFLIVFSLLLAACSTQEPTTPEAITVTPTASAPITDLSDFYQQIVTWAPCEDLSGVLCTSIAVPLNYQEPSGITIQIHLAKLPAEKNKIRSLLFNPGGPGASGISYLAYSQEVFSKNLLENFDVVAFDPRGVGISNPIDCLTDEELDYFLAFDGTPDTDQEVADFLELTKQMAAGCEENENNLVAHIGTRNAARDMDVIRAILNEDKLDFLGVSYGSFLGATYADMFPENVGQFVLDGGVDPQIDSKTLSFEQALGLENALERFLTDCFTNRDCPFQGNIETARSEILKFLSQLDQNPIPTEDSNRDLTQAMATYSIAAFLYSKNYWPFLRDAFNAAFDGDGSLFLYVNDLFNERNSDGTFASNISEAIYAINCFDKPATDDAKAVRELAAEWKQQAPIFGDYLAWSNLACGYWPAAETDDFILKAAGTNPILVVGTLNDPATPYKWSVALVEQLENAILLTLDGDGHTAYMTGSDCIDQVVDDFFVSKKIPEKDLTCK
ncbi:MAG: alpha/beta fold hydrolase [Candidatus Nanopelagicales bacterium]